MSNNLIEKLTQHLDFPQLFQIVLNEDITQKIYDEFNMDESERTLSNLNHQLATVLGIRVHESDYYGLIQYQSRIMGWTRLEHSYYVHPKRLESVKINPERFSTPKFNSKMGLHNDLHLAFKDKLLTSKGYVYDGDEKLELLFTKGKLKGFVYPGDLHRSMQLEQPLLIAKDVKLYKDSNFIIEVDKWSNDNEFLTKLIFPTLDLLKVQRGRLQYWLRLSATDLFVPSVVSDDTSIDAIVKEVLKTERNKTKPIIENLLKAQLDYERQLQSYEQQVERLHRIEKSYNNLKQSKLGRIQVKVWELLRGRRKND